LLFFRQIIPYLKYPALNQFIRYGVVGLLNNALGYLVYLIVTFFWLDPKVAITMLYPLAAVMAYFGHMNYAFKHEGRRTHSLLRYGVAHVMGYGLNFMMLLILVERFKLPHQWVQAMAIPVLAGFLFLMLKYFVFPAPVIRVQE